MQESTFARREWIISGSNPETYEWDTEETITAEEMKKAMSDREIYLADIKRRQDEYQANKNTIPTNSNNKGDFKF